MKKKLSLIFALLVALLIGGAVFPLQRAEALPTPACTIPTDTTDWEGCGSSNPALCPPSSAITAIQGTGPNGGFQVKRGGVWSSTFRLNGDGTELFGICASADAGPIRKIRFFNTYSWSPPDAYPGFRIYINDDVNPCIEVHGASLLGNATVDFGPTGYFTRLVGMGDGEGAIQWRGFDSAGVYKSVQNRIRNGCN